MIFMGILFYIYNGIGIYDIIKDNSITFILYNIDKFYFINSIISIIIISILFVSSLRLLFMKSIITDDLIILSDGLFKIETIRKIEKSNKNTIKILLKKKSPYAVFGYKIFKVNKNNIEEIFNYINEKIKK
jgi:hypothetical protein